MVFRNGNFSAFSRHLKLNFRLFTAFYMQKTRKQTVHIYSNTHCLINFVDAKEKKIEITLFKKNLVRVIVLIVFKNVL
jgi:hypothetical protein